MNDNIFFKPGQLVTLWHWAADDESGGLGLFTEPGISMFTARRVGCLLEHDVALVIGAAGGLRDKDCVYVVGPNGGGWTFCGLLRILQ